MKDLRFHYGGMRDHLAHLRADLSSRIRRIRSAEDLSAEEKQERIESLKARFSEREKQLLSSLY
ncbi:MAG: hypothetical protein R3301_03730 [Saprospiraceae bacterium]|nr:hypothetical protein [Saprospiraceae bacterium]